MVRLFGDYHINAIMKKIKIKCIDAFETTLCGYADTLINQLNKRYEIELSDDPDFVLCGCFSNDFFKYECPKIYFTGENVTPDFNFYDYSVGFDFINYGDRYLRFPIYPYWADDFKLAQTKHMRSDDYFMNKDKFCCWVASNGRNQDIERDKIFSCISQYKTIESGGRYRNNLGYRVNDKIDFLKNYKFSLAMENSVKSGYVTEKIVQAWAGGTIPIYYGDKDIVKEFNTSAFINACDFDSWRDLSQYVESIDNDKEKYLKMQHEPIFKDNSLCRKYFSFDILYNYIFSILDQKPENAKRVLCRHYGYQNDYENMIRRGWGITMAVKKPYRFLRDRL